MTAFEERGRAGKNENDRIVSQKSIFICLNPVLQMRGNRISLSKNHRRSEEILTVQVFATKLASAYKRIAITVLRIRQSNRDKLRDCQCWLIRPVLVQCTIITPTLIGSGEHLVIDQLKEYYFFSAFHWSTRDTPLASQCITVQWPISKTLCGPCIVIGY